MRKFKLIKEYPNSLKLGSVISKSGCMFLYEDLCNGKYSEFWEEIKEYPNVVLIRNATNGAIFRLCENGLYTSCSLDYIVGTYSKEHLLSKPHMNIHQVAVSENEIFTIGDKVIHNHKDGTKRHGDITRFTYKEPYMYVDVDYDKTSGYSFATIDTIEKYKQSLFTTKDGIDKHFGDMYYYVLISNVFTNVWKVMIDRVDWESPSKPPLGQIQFDDRDKAEEWIFNNKPIFSMKDIDNAIMKVHQCTASERFLAEFKEKLLSK